MFPPARFGQIAARVLAALTQASDLTLNGRGRSDVGIGGRTGGFARSI